MSETEELHPYERRSKAIREALFFVMIDGPASWEAIFGAGVMIEKASGTMRNAVNEGVNFGVFEKSGGRSGKGPAMVSLTYLGRRYGINTFLEGIEPS